jgi:phosphotransacetylase
MHIEYLSRLMSMAKKSGTPHRLAVAAAGERVCLEAVTAAQDEGLIEGVLFGNQEVIESILGHLDRAPGEFEIHHAPEPVESAERAVQAVAAGQCSMLMKGMLHTRDLFRIYFDKRHGLRTDRPLSHASLFEVPGFGRLFAMTDAALNVAPDEERLMAITRNGVDFMRRLGWRRPRVALLAATSTVFENQPATVIARRIAERAREELPEAEVVGPLAMDEAVSHEAAATKGMDDPVAGSADLIVVPSLECGNSIYKTLTLFAHAKVVGACLGGRVPIVITSRADTEETKLLTMALSCCLAGESGPA